MIPTFTALGAGPTLLMLHGIGGSYRAFAPQVESFANAGYHAVAWDMPGYGHSAPIEPYTFKGLAQRCIALIEALLAADAESGRRRAATAQALPLGGLQGAQRDERGGVILLGHGMGGMVAQEVVARRPDLVSRLVLSGTSAAFDMPPGLASAGNWPQDFVAGRTAWLDAGGSMAELAQTLVPQMIGPGSLPEGVQLATYCMAQVHPATYRRALEALTTFDRRANLAHIAVPTLLVSGEFDREAPTAAMQAMAEAIPGSRLYELPGVGQLQNLEAPDEFDRLVLDFLAAMRRMH